MDLEPKFKKGGRWSRKSKVGRMSNNLEHGGEVGLKGGVRTLGEPLRGKPLGCDPFRKGSVHLDLDLKDEVRKGGQARNPILEGKARSHREDAKIDLLKVKAGKGISHDSCNVKKRDTKPA
jgi:hypothetical protein